MGKKNKGKRNGKQRTAAKTEKKEAKRAARVQQRYEAEIEAYLEKTLAEERCVAADDVARPTPRAHCSLVAHPSDGRTLVFFGGSTMRRGRIQTYRDLYKYRVDKGTWSRRITAPMPLPRCSHQCVALRYGGRDLMYLYGGEYTTPDGEKFRHFGGAELWVCDLGRDAWELAAVATPAAECPAPRSGHRMAAWGKRLVLFGGYYSAGETTRYFNDLWLYDVERACWERAEFPAGALLPDPRSGCQIAVHGDTLYVFGGFARSRPPEIQRQLQAQRAQKGRRNFEEEFLLEAMAEEQESGVYYSDVWRVNLRDVVDANAARRAASSSSTASSDPAAPPPRTVVALWEHVRAAGKGMVPARTGVTAGMYKERVFFFGGVCDNEDYDSDDDDDFDPAEDGDRLAGDSLFFNELWTFNIAKQKWFPTKMKEKKGAAAAAAAAAGAEAVVPSVRYGMQATVLGSDMYLYGGMVEKLVSTRRRTAVTEVTYDDLYRLNLAKLDGFTMVLPPTVGGAKVPKPAAPAPAAAPAAPAPAPVPASPAPAAEKVAPKTEAPAPAVEKVEGDEGEESDGVDDEAEVEVVPEYLVDVDSPSSSSSDEEGDEGDEGEGDEGEEGEGEEEEEKPTPEEAQQ